MFPNMAENFANMHFQSKLRPDRYMNVSVPNLEKFVVDRFMKTTENFFHSSYRLYRELYFLSKKIFVRILIRNLKYKRNTITFFFLNWDMRTHNDVFKTEKCPFCGSAFPLIFPTRKTLMTQMSEYTNMKCKGINLNHQRAAFCNFFSFFFSNEHIFICKLHAWN